MAKQKPTTPRTKAIKPAVSKASFQQAARVVAKVNRRAMEILKDK